MISPTTKHQLITDLDEARYTLSHMVDKTPDECAIQDELRELITHVRDLPVEGEVSVQDIEHRKEWALG